MFDLGWTELLVIGVVALIVVGPKDLPMLFRKVGQFVGKAKGMAREFSQAMDQAAEESGVKEATSSFKDMTSSKNLGLDGLDKATSDLKNWNPDSETGKLAAERAETVRKLQETAEANHKERLARQAERKAEADVQAAAEATPPAKPAPAAKKAAPKKTAATKAPAKKPAAKKPAATKTAAHKTAAKKAPAKKAAPKKAAAKDT